MKKPEETFRAGLVSASLFMNERTVQGKKVIIPSVSIQKRYKDGDEWKSTNSFSVNDLPRLIFVLTQAYATIYEDQDANEAIGDPPVSDEMPLNEE